MTIPPEVWPVLGTTVAALLAWLGVWTKTKGDKDVADKPDWPEFSESLMKRVDAQEKRIDRLVEDVEHLNSQVSSLRRKYNAALRMVRELTHRHPDTSVDVPHEIVDDL